MTKRDSGFVGELAANAAESPTSVFAPTVDIGDAAHRGPDGEPAPDITRTEAAVESRSVRSVSLIVLAVLATLYTLYFARDFFVPIVFAVLLNFLFSPLLRMLARFRIPSPVAAAVVVALLVGAVGGGMYSLAGPAQTLAASAPETLAKANRRLRTLILARVQNAATQVERAAGTLGGTAAVDRTARPIVVSTAPTIGSRIPAPHKYSWRGSSRSRFCCTSSSRAAISFFRNL